MNISIANTVDEVEKFNGINIIVDFFRFSNTVSILLSRKKNIRIYSDEEKAVDFYLKNINDWDLFSEKDLKVKKFDNSPYLALTERLKDNIIVVTNSGSKAVLASKKSNIIIASFINISSVKKYLLDKKEILITPACIFFNKNHIEDFIVSKAIMDYINGFDIDLEKIRKEIEKAKRIDELISLRKTAKKDLDIIFSIDRFNVIPKAVLKNDFAEVVNEESSY